MQLWTKRFAKETNDNPRGQLLHWPLFGAKPFLSAKTPLPQETKLLSRRAHYLGLVLYNFWNICRRLLEFH